MIYVCAKMLNIIVKNILIIKKVYFGPENIKMIKIQTNNMQCVALSTFTKLGGIQWLKSTKLSVGQIYQNHKKVHLNGQMSNKYKKTKLCRFLGFVYNFNFILMKDNVIF